MKQTKFLLSGLCAVVLLTACNNSTGGSAGAGDSSSKTAGVTTPADNTKTTADSGTNATTSMQNAGKLDTADAAFLKKAASGGLLEVQLGTLAGSNGSSPRVKSFGEMMVKDHSNANQKLKALASQLNAPVSDSLLPDHAHHKMMLAAKKGAEFDKAYMKMMVEDHNEDIEDFQKASKSSNTNVSSFASQTLPVLMVHLDSAKAIVAGKHK